MKKIILIYIFLLLLILPKQVNSKEFFESNFVNINIDTFNPNETKINSINKIKIESLYKLIDIILDDKSKEKFINLLKDYSIDQFIQSLVIDNEIITNNKYIASIKVNYSREKIVNFFRNNKINYTDLKSKPYLVISAYNIGFSRIG